MTVLSVAVSGLHPTHAVQKPSEWAEAIESAAATRPAFWLDGSPDWNRGDVLGGQLDIRGISDAELLPGFWGQGNGAFRINSAQPSAPAFVVHSERTTIGCSPDGALALLFRSPPTPLIKNPEVRNKQLLIARGAVGVNSPFEIAIVDDKIRILTWGAGERPEQVQLPEVLPSSWYWLAISWHSQDEMVEVDWRLLALPSNLLEHGSFSVLGLGDDESRLVIGGSYTGDHAVHSQIIIWESPVEKAAWLKIEGLLK